MTLKEIQQLKQPYPYEKVAEQLNNLPILDEKTVDNIIGKAEAESLSMVSLSKLKPLLKKEVKDFITDYMHRLKNS